MKSMLIISYMFVFQHITFILFASFISLYFHIDSA